MDHTLTRNKKKMTSRSKRARVLLKRLSMATGQEQRAWDTVPQSLQHLCLLGPGHGCGCREGIFSGRDTADMTARALGHTGSVSMVRLYFPFLLF